MYVNLSDTHHLTAAKVDQTIAAEAKITPSSPLRFTSTDRPANPITGKRQYPVE